MLGNIPLWAIVTDDELKMTRDDPGLLAVARTNSSTSARKYSITAAR